MKQVTIEKGIIESNLNPFVVISWTKKRFALTTHRQMQLSELFGQDKESILMTLPRNDGKYVAFVAIRWGFATFLKNKLTPTEKWTNRDIYDGHGELKRTEKKLVFTCS